MTDWNAPFGGAPKPNPFDGSPAAQPDPWGSPAVAPAPAASAQIPPWLQPTPQPTHAAPPTWSPFASPAPSQTIAADPFSAGPPGGAAAAAAAAAAKRGSKGEELFKPAAAPNAFAAAPAPAAPAAPAVVVAPAPAAAPAAGGPPPPPTRTTPAGGLQAAPAPTAEEAARLRAQVAAIEQDRSRIVAEFSSKLKNMEAEQERLKQQYAEAVQAKEAAEKNLQILSADESQRSKDLAALREQHNKELEQERLASHQHLKAIVAEYQAQSAASLEEERSRGVTILQKTVAEEQTKCFELMKAQQKRLSEILKTNIEDFQGTLKNIIQHVTDGTAQSVDNAINRESARLATNVEEALRAARESLQGELKVMQLDMQKQIGGLVQVEMEKAKESLVSTTSALRTELTTANEAAVKTVQDGFKREQEATATLRTQLTDEVKRMVLEELAAERERSKTRWAEQSETLRKELTAKVESEKDRMRDMIQEAAQRSERVSQEARTSITKAFDDGREALEKSASSIAESHQTKLQAELDAQRTTQMRSLAAVRMFVESASAQLATLLNSGALAPQ